MNYLFIQIQLRSLTVNYGHWPSIRVC